MFNRYVLSSPIWEEKLTITSQSSKPFLAVAAGLVTLADSHGNHDLIILEQLDILRQYQRAYNTTESLILKYDVNISRAWGENWREAFGSLTPQRAKHMFASLKALSGTVDLATAVKVITGVVRKRAESVI